MIPASFDYVAPTSLREAIGLLEQHGDDAKLLAGGHSLLPLMKLRLASPAILVDLARIPYLSYIRDDGAHIAIGAMTRYTDLVESEVLRRRVPLLAEAAAMVGDAQVRNRGTLGGALAHADPAGDMPVILSALGGSVSVVGPGDKRTIAAQDFFRDIFTSAMEPNEILVEVHIPAPDGAGQNYQKFRRRAIDWAIVGAAVNVIRSNGTIASARVVLTNVGSVPMHATAVEEALRGRTADAATVFEASELGDRDIDPTPELYAPADYKRHLARVLTRRALTAALGLTS